MSYLHTIPKSIGYAWSGVKSTFINEPNFRVHLIAACSAVATGVIVHLSPVEWALLVFTITAVVVLELVNTSIETIVNMISPEWNDAAKLAKDTAAAAVLLASFAAVLIGACLFGPKLL